MYRNQTFKFRLMQIFGALLLILGVSVTAIFYFRTSKIVFELSEQLSSEVVSKVREKTDSFLQVPSSMTKLVSPLIDHETIVEDHEQLWKFMWQPILMIEQLESYFIADLRGSYVQVRRTPVFETRLIDRTLASPKEFRIQRTKDYDIVEEKEKIPTFDPRTRIWYKETGIKERYYWTDAYVATTSQKPVVGCAYPVLTGEGNRGAVVCVNIPIEKLSTFLKEQKISENSVLLIVDQSEQIIAAQDFQDILLEDTLTNSDGSVTTSKRIKKLSELELTHVVDAYERHSTEGIKEFRFEHGGDKFFFKVAAISDTIGVDWKIVSVIPEKDLLYGVTGVIRNIIIAIAGMFLISIFVIFYVSGRITAPLEQLSTLNEKIQNFDLNIEDRVTSSIAEINNMSISLFNAIKGLKAFQKYVPADLVRQLIDTGQEVEVGGVPKTLTLFFSDIKGFTSISEKLASDFLMQHLSEYFDELSRIIMNKQGTIDKFIGDSIMAFWGAPVEHVDSPIKACQAALLCQKKLMELNEGWKTYNKPIMETRIGIGTGQVVVGNVGSSTRINYSAIGDHVNLSSRIEGLNKIYGTKIIIDERTYEEVKVFFFCRQLDIVAVSGKKNGTKIYELISEQNDLPDERTQLYAKTYEKGLAFYLKKDWTNALKYFFYLKKNFDSNDKAVNLFIKRCSYFRKHPDLLPPAWNGVTNLTEK